MALFGQVTMKVDGTRQKGCLNWRKLNSIGDTLIKILEEKSMNGLGSSGEDKSRVQPATFSSLVKWLLKWCLRVCVCYL